MSIMALALVFLTVLIGMCLFIGSLLGWALCNYLQQVIFDEPRDYQS